MASVLAGRGERALGMGEASRRVCFVRAIFEGMYLCSLGRRRWFRLETVFRWI